MRTLYLLRHGRTEANERHLYCGATDLPLSPAGRAALAPLHLPLRDPRFFTSGLRRTEETLRLLFGEVPHRADTRLRELDFGVFEMHGYEELKHRADYQAWLSGDNERNTPPGGESGEEMRRRVLEALHELAALPDDVVVVTHGGVIAAAMEALFPQEQRSRYDWQPAPGGGYAVTLSPERAYRTIPE